MPTYSGTKIVQIEDKTKQKSKNFYFFVEMQPILFKDSAKNRFSEEKENKLSFLSVRFLFKSKTKQNKSPKTFIFLLRCSLSYLKIVQKIDLAKKKSVFA